MATFDPSAFLLDPTYIRQQQLSQMLLNAGAGLLSGRNWQQGLSGGLMGAGQAASSAQDQLRQQAMLGLQLQKFAQPQLITGDQAKQVGLDPKSVYQYIPGEGYKTVQSYADTAAGKVDIAGQTANAQVPAAIATALGKPIVAPPASQVIIPQPFNPATLQGLTQTESGGNPTAVSPAGAIGATQLMPDTAKQMAQELGLQYDPARLNDPVYNSAIGGAYLAKMTQQYGGNGTLGLLAYHAGPGNVDKWLKDYGDPRQGKIGWGDFLGKIQASGYPASAAYPGQVAQNTPQVIFGNTAPPPGTPENAFNATRGKDMATEAQGISDAANRAYNTKNSLSQMKYLFSAYKAAGGDTGKLAAIQNNAAAWLQGIGLDPSKFNLTSDAGWGQAIQTATNQMALQMIGTNKPGDQGAIPSNQFSEADRNFVVSLPPNLGQTETGRAMVMDIMNRVADRNILAEKMRNQYPDTPDGFRQFKAAMRDYADKHPLYSDEERQQMVDQIQSSTKAATSPQVYGEQPGPGRPVTINGQTYEFLGRNPDGKLRVRDQSGQIFLASPPGAQ